MDISKITRFLETFAPLELQEGYDNAGLIIGNHSQKVTQALICLDCTEAVVDEAIEKGCELIICHHPIIFKGLKQLNGKNYIERIIIKAVQNNIAIYAIHTNLDNVYEGVNKKICERLGLVDCRILAPKNGHLKKLVVYSPIDHAEKIRTALCEAGAGSIANYDYCTFNSIGEGTFKGNEKSNPFSGERGKLTSVKEVKIEVIFTSHLQKNILNAMRKAHPYEVVAHDIFHLENRHQNIGSGMIGRLAKPMDSQLFLTFVKEKMKTDCIRHTHIHKKEVQTIAVCGGSGSFLLANAKRQQADVFITADVKYHDFFDAEDSLIIADIGHYESEQFTSELIQEILKENFPKFAAHLSVHNTNPINYL